MKKKKKQKNQKIKIKKLMKKHKNLDKNII